ncbi:MAG: hypothetical protein IJS94_00575 [Clostridia bacterium]|nr:hypothetical protein [Clostridia bacterium]
MFSFKGPGLKIFAAIIALIAIAGGVYLTFFSANGYVKTTAEIISIENDPDYIPDPNVSNDTGPRIVTVKYTVDGKEYKTVLDSDSGTYKVGKEIEILYDPKDPTKISSGKGFGIYLIIAGGVIFFGIIIFTIINKKKVKELKGKYGETVYAPSEKRELRTLYFLTDLGTPKYGHRIEDKDRKVLYEAKMTKFTLTNPFGFDFIDHENGTTTPHYVGHEEQTEWNSLIIDNHSTFTFDGEDIWKHLKKNGITFNAHFASGKILAPEFYVFRDGEQIAEAITTCQYPHEEDEAQHSIANKVPVRGFYRIKTSEKNLDLLFVVMLSIARTSAMDNKGGERSILFGRK